MSTLTPRHETFDLAAYEVPHPRPYLLDLVVASDQLSRVVDHVSNVEYVRWVDRAAELHADSLGATRASLAASGCMWFVARHEIDYLAESHAGDRLVVATWVRDIGRVKSWRDTVVVRPADARIVLRASTLWVLVDLARRRPTRITGPLRASLESALMSSSRDQPCASR